MFDGIAVDACRDVVVPPADELRRIRFPRSAGVDDTLVRTGCASRDPVETVPPAPAVGAATFDDVALDLVTPRSPQPCCSRYGTYGGDVPPIEDSAPGRASEESSVVSCVERGVSTTWSPSRGSARSCVSCAVEAI